MTSSLQQQPSAIATQSASVQVDVPVHSSSEPIQLALFESEAVQSAQVEIVVRVEPSVESKTATAAAEQSAQVVDDLPLPSRRLLRVAHWFRIGLAVFVLISSLLGLTGCSASTSVPWQPATQVMPEATIEQVINENTSLEPAEFAQLRQQVQAWSVPGKVGKLAIVNYNTDKLCGQLGCLYSGVWLQEGQAPRQVFSAYLDPSLPPGNRLFTVLDATDPAVAGREQAALPCFMITQVEPGSEHLQTVKLCFNGQQYQTVEGTLIGEPSQPKSELAPAEGAASEEPAAKISRSPSTLAHLPLGWLLLGH